MNAPAQLKQQHRARVAENVRSQAGSNNSTLSQFAINRPEAIVQSEVRETLNQSARVESQLQLKQSLNRNPRVAAQAKLAHTLSEHAAGRLPIQRVLIVGGATFRDQIPMKRNLGLRDRLSELEDGEEIRRVLNFWALAGRGKKMPGPTMPGQPSVPASQQVAPYSRGEFSTWEDAIVQARIFIMSGGWMLQNQLIEMSRMLDAQLDERLLASMTGDVSIGQEAFIYQAYKNRILNTVYPDNSLLIDALIIFDYWQRRLAELQELSRNQEALAALKEKEKALEQQEGQNFVDELFKRGQKLTALSASSAKFGTASGELAYLQLELLKTDRVLDFYNLDDEAKIQTMDPTRIATRTAEIHHLFALVQQGAYVQVGIMSVRTLCNRLKRIGFNKMVELVSTYCDERKITTIGADGIGWFPDHVEFVQMKSSVLPPLQEMKEETEHMKETRIPLHDMLIGAAKQLEGVVAKGEKWNGEFTVRGEQSKRRIILTFSNPAALEILPEQYLEVVNDVLGRTPSPVYRQKSLTEHVEEVEIRLPGGHTLLFNKTHGEFVGGLIHETTTTTTLKPPTGETKTTL